MRPSTHLYARRKLIRAMGRPMVLSRTVSGSDPTTYLDVTVLGFVTTYLPPGNVTADRQAAALGLVLLGDQKIEVLNDEIAGAAWPAPPVRNDRLTVDGYPRTVQNALGVYDGPLLIGWTIWVRA